MLKLQVSPPAMNAFHRALLCWSFQRALASNEHITNLVKEINPDFADFYIALVLLDFMTAFVEATEIERIQSESE